MNWSKHFGSNIRWTSRTSYARKSTKVIWEIKTEERHFKLNYQTCENVILPHSICTFFPANHFLSPRNWENNLRVPGSCFKYSGFSFSCNKKKILLHALFRLSSNLTVQGYTKANSPLLGLFFFTNSKHRSFVLFPTPGVQKGPLVKSYISTVFLATHFVLFPADSQIICWIPYMTHLARKAQIHSQNLDCSKVLQILVGNPWTGFQACQFLSVLLHSPHLKYTKSKHLLTEFSWILSMHPNSHLYQYHSHILCLRARYRRMALLCEILVSPSIR